MLSEKSFIVRHPVFTALIFFILISFFSAVPAIFIGILELSEIHTMNVYTASGRFRFLGFLPLVLVTGVIFVAGMDTTLSVIL